MRALLPLDDDLVFLLDSRIERHARMDGTTPSSLKNAPGGIGGTFLTY